MDPRGWGGTTPAPVPYDLAGWSGPDRWPSYMAAALGDGLMGQRVRDLVAAGRWLGDRDDIDSKHLALVGVGLGGLVALQAAALLAPAPVAVLTVDSPQSIEAIVAAPDYSWAQDVFQPGLLREGDVADFAEALQARAVRPRRPDGTPLAGDLADEGAAIDWLWDALGIA